MCGHFSTICPQKGEAMANKETLKVHIDRNRFFEALRTRKSSIRKLGQAYNEIGRTERTIRRAVEAGEMSPELLDSIARYLDVHPDFISGIYDEKAERIKESQLRDYYISTITPDNHPYIEKAYSDLDYPHYFNEILTDNFITTKQFESLAPVERVLLRQELSVAIMEVLAKHFKADAFGRNLADLVSYYKSNVDDFDPFSYFAELEGISISGDVKFDDWDELTEEEQALDRKYSIDPRGV